MQGGLRAREPGGAGELEIRSPIGNPPGSLPSPFEMRTEDMGTRSSVLSSEWYRGGSGEIGRLRFRNAADAFCLRRG